MSQASITTTRTADSSTATTRGPGVVLGFCLAGMLLGLSTTLERALHHSYLYTGAADVLLHISVALLSGLAVGGVLGGFAEVSFRSFVARRSASRRHWLRAASLVLGAALGAGLYRMIIGPSKYAAGVPAGLGVGCAAISLGAAGVVLSPLLVRAIARAPRPCAAILGGAVVPLMWIDMHSYLRSYGNVHVVITGLALLALGVATSIILSRVATSNRVWLSLGAIALVAGAYLSASNDSMRVRSAVLEFGVVEKLLIRHVVWPLTDRDGDGYSTWPWGTDCDDGDGAVSPLSSPHRMPEFGCDPIPSRVATGETRRPAPPRLRHSLVLILVDTWRLDTPSAPPAQLEHFVRFTGFRSCGSRTEEVVGRLLGGRRCLDAGPLPPFATQLRSRGYRTATFGQYTRVGPHFEVAEEFAAASDAVAAALAWIRKPAQRDAPYFVFVHLKGGHRPYSGVGGTPRERYESAVSESLEHALSLVEQLGEEPVVALMGDHGEEFGEHEGGAHASSLYEEVLATHLYVRAPGWPATTEAALLGCDDARDLFLAAAAGGQFRPPARPSLFSQLDSPPGVHGGLSQTLIYSLRLDADSKLIWKPRIGVWELYDLGQDPGERHNLADTQPRRLRDAASSLLGELGRCERGTDLDTLPHSGNRAAGRPGVDPARDGGAAATASASLPKTE